VVGFCPAGQFSAHEHARAYQSYEREQQRNGNAGEDDHIHDLATWRFLDSANR
jgi:hypothetical protein